MVNNNIIIHIYGYWLKLITAGKLVRIRLTLLFKKKQYYYTLVLLLNNW